MRSGWKTTEHAIIRQNYPAGGINACEPLLPGRSRSAIYQQARILGCKSDSMPAVRKSYPSDPHVDQQIRFAHQTTTKKGDIEALAARLNRPAWWVSRRARDLGLVTPRFRELPWSAEEIQILEDTADRPAKSAQRALKTAGFNRTMTAVIVKRKRVGIRAADIPGVYTTGQVAGLLGYERGTVQRWITFGLLSASKHGDDSIISDAQLREFMTRHPMQADLRRLPLANRPWLIELLTGRGAMTISEAVGL